MTMAAMATCIAGIFPASQFAIAHSIMSVPACASVMALSSARAGAERR